MDFKMTINKYQIIWPDQSDSSFLLIQNLIISKKWKEARESLIKLIENVKYQELNLCYLKNNLGVIYIEIGLHNLAVECFESISSIVNKANNKKSIFLYGIIQLNLAFLYYDESRWNNANYHAKLAIDCFHSIGKTTLLQITQKLIIDIQLGRQTPVIVLDDFTNSKDPIERITKLREVSKIYEDKDLPTEAINTLEQAINICTKEILYSFKAILLNDIAILYRQDKLYEKSKIYFEQALRLSLKVNDRKTEASIRNNYGLLFKDVDQFNKAIKMFEEAITIKSEIGENSGAIHFNIAKTYKKMGNMALALEHAKKTLEIDKINNPQKIEADYYLIQSIEDKVSYNKI